MLLNRTHKIAAVYVQICPRPRILPPFFHTQFPMSAWAIPFSLFLFLWLTRTAKSAVEAKRKCTVDNDKPRRNLTSQERMVVNCQTFSFFVSADRSVHAIEIEKERMESPKLKLCMKKRRQNTRAWADLLINCGNFMSSI